MILSMDVRLGIDGIYHIVEYNEWGGCRVKALMFNCLVKYLFDPKGFSQVLNDLWINFLNLFSSFCKLWKNR